MAPDHGHDASLTALALLSMMANPSVIATMTMPIAAVSSVCPASHLVKMSTESKTDLDDWSIRGERQVSDRQEEDQEHAVG